MFSVGSLLTLDLLKSIQRAETECSKELPDLFTKTLFWYRTFCFSAWNNLEGSWKESPNSGKWNVTYRNWKKKSGSDFCLWHASTSLLLLPGHFLCAKRKKFPVKEGILLKAQACSTWYINLQKAGGKFPLV